LSPGSLNPPRKVTLSACCMSAGDACVANDLCGNRSDRLGLYLFTRYILQRLRNDNKAGN